MSSSTGPLDRRSFLGSTGLGVFAALASLERAFAQGDMTSAEAQAERAHERLSSAAGMIMHGHEEVAMLLYPKFTALDLVGPYFFFAGMMGATVHLVTNQPTLAPVASDHGLAIAPTVQLADCPRELTVLFVPGGAQGTVDAMRDRATREFLATRAATTRFVTSVCTGSLLLGAAGLLRGKRATSHWAVRELLQDFGARPVDARVVTDGAVITGAGVSAGLDFALTIVEQLRGRAYAQMLMLAAEYAPKPPLKGGTEQLTAREISEPMREMFLPLAVQIKEIARDARL